MGAKGMSWEYADHAVTERFEQNVADMIDEVDRRGRGGDLDNIVGYSQEPRGEVSRLTALFWTIDEDYQKPARDLIDEFRREAREELGEEPTDEQIYEIMYRVWEDKRSE